MRKFWNTKGGLQAIEEWAPNCWVQVTCPDQDDVMFLQDTLKFPIISYQIFPMPMSVLVMSMKRVGV